MTAEKLERYSRYAYIVLGGITVATIFAGMNVAAWSQEPDAGKTAAAVVMRVIGVTLPAFMAAISLNAYFNLRGKP